MSQSLLALTVYGRHGCHLCEEMLRDLQRLAEQIPLVWRVEDVDQRTDWRAQYGNDVPVLTTQTGRVLCRHRLDETALRQWMRELA